jgi:hypothetical protein
VAGFLADILAYFLTDTDTRGGGLHPRRASAPSGSGLPSQSRFTPALTGGPGRAASRPQDRASPAAMAKAT